MYTELVADMTLPPFLIYTSGTNSDSASGGIAAVKLQAFQPNHQDFGPECRILVAEIQRFGI